jgi:NAD(P)-dependent dehydrogenase (short-subunit alcohol dehydrogenase family)
MDVVLADVDEDAARTVANEVEALGRKALAVKTDVADFASVERLADAAFAQFGAVHVVCNNAGVLVAGPIADMRPDDWHWLFSVNVFGVIHGIHAFLPRLLAQGGEAHIVNTASTAGFQAGTGYVPIYAATKNAVVSITEALQGELEPTSIGVSGLCPSTVNTRILEAQRNRPTEFGTLAAEPLSAAPITSGMPPDEVGRKVRQAILDNEPWIITHPEAMDVALDRFRRFTEVFEAAKKK